MTRQIIRRTLPGYAAFLPPTLRSASGVGVDFWLRLPLAVG